MKIAIFLFAALVTSFTSTAQETKVYSVYNDLIVGNIYHLFSTDVKLRKEPNTTSEVLKTLALGAEINVLEKTKDTMTYQGELANWYKVKYNDLTGYVLRSLIAINYQEMGSTTYLFNVARIDEMDNLKVRVLRADGTLINQKYNLNTGTFQIEIDDSKGLDKVLEIIFIHYYAEACGVDGGGIYLFYDGERLVKAAELQRVADADLFWYVEELIFPDDDESLKNKVRYTRESGETIDYETNWVEEKYFSREYEWSGSGWNPPLDQE
jgi:hypothetical protein